MIQVQMRHDDVANIGAREPQCLYLFGNWVVEQWVGPADKLLAHPNIRSNHGLLPVAGVHQRQSRRMLDQQAVARPHGPPQNARTTIDQPPTERPGTSSVQMMDMHNTAPIHVADQPAT